MINDNRTYGIFFTAKNLDDQFVNKNLKIIDIENIIFLEYTRITI